MASIPSLYPPPLPIPFYSSSSTFQIPCKPTKRSKPKNLNDHLVISKVSCNIKQNSTQKKKTIITQQYSRKTQEACSPWRRHLRCFYSQQQHANICYQGSIKGLGGSKQKKTEQRAFSFCYLTILNSSENLVYPTSSLVLTFIILDSEEI